MSNWIPAQAFADIARGDKDAENLMGILYIFFHKQDDLFDRDRPVSAENSAGIDLQTLRAFTKNSFAQKHQDFLFPVLTMGALAWAASEDRKHSEDVLERLTAQVLKSEYQNVFFAIAFCIGGWDHALAMGRRYRDYHFDSESPGSQLSLDNKAKIGQTG